ncbi:MAG: sigma factor-like helix-turn-helix DNA-binding protein [Planctomycetota bacterium]
MPEPANASISEPDYWPVPGPRLTAMIDELTEEARRVLWWARRGGVDFHDAVSSALRTYERQGAEGEIDPPADETGLWEALRGNLDRKLAKVRHSQKYDKNRSSRFTELTAGDEPPAEFADPRGRPKPNTVEQYLDHLMRLFDGLPLSEEQRRVIEAKLQGYTTAEVAARLGLSEHQVRRRVSQVRRLIEAEQQEDQQDA